MHIIVANHGTVAANRVRLWLSFGGSNDRKNIQDIAVPPKNEIPYTFLLRMTPERYAAGEIEGNRFNAIIDGSYTGLGGRNYPYKERQDYDPELKRFVPSMTNW